MYEKTFMKDSTEYHYDVLLIEHGRKDDLLNTVDERRSITSYIYSG
jgi:hypothetical protein